MAGLPKIYEIFLARGPRRTQIPGVNSRKNLFIVASALLASASAGHAELRLIFSTYRSYRQSPAQVVFHTGDLGIRMWDGNWIYGCGPAPDFYPPSPICPLGSTAYLAAGDGDGDGVRDDFSYWEVVTLIPGVALEPNRPELCALFSSPPSKLPRPIGNFTDLTDTLFYNLVDPSEPIRMYKLPDYSLQLFYETRTAMDQQVVTGLYQFAFPRLGLPEQLLAIPVTHYAMPEGYQEKNNVRQGFRFTGLNGKPLVFDAAGFVGMDPRVANTFTWAGNTADFIFPSLDNLYVAISDLVAAPLGDPTRVANLEAPTVYPGFFVGAPTKESRVLLANALATEVVIPPGFVKPPVVSPNREAVLRLMLERLAASSTVAYDSSSRVYELPLRFINTYEGWAAVSFRPGTLTSSRAKEVDFDGDGFINYLEWLNSTDPTSRTSFPRSPVLRFMQARATRSTGSAGTGYWEAKQQKDPTIPQMVYEYEFSTDLGHWRTVGSEDPDWVLLETPDEIKIQSRYATLQGHGFLRVKMTQLPPVGGS